MKALGFLCLLFACALSASALDREAFTFTSYDLEVRVEPEQQRLGVRGRLELRNDSAAVQNNAVLQICSSLNWSSIRIEGKPAQFLSQSFISDIDHTGALSEAIVTLPKPVAPKQAITLEIGYEGIIPQDVTRLTRIGVPPDVAKHSDWDQISRSFTAVRGIGNVAWYPIATEAANLSEGNSVLEAVGRWKQRQADAELRIRFIRFADSSPTQHSLLCGQDEKQGIHVSRECTFRNLNSTVPFFASGDFVPLERPEVSIFHLLGHESQAEDYGLAVEEAAPYIEKLFGDRPTKSNTKPELIELPDTDASPFQSSGTMLMPLSGNENALLMSAVQQVTQLAFPSLRSWIHDGLARYAAVSFLQEREGREAALQYLRNHRSSLIQTEKQAVGETDRAEHSLINSTDEFFVQTKAMSVWWMLRDMVGEAPLSAALHNYQASEDKTPGYMQKLIETQAHRDLKWFFDDWVYHDRGLPDFRIKSVYPRELVNGGYMVTVTVENSGQVAAEVPVILRTAGRESSEKLMVSGNSNASVRIVCPSFPQQAIVNDGSVPEIDESNNVYKIEELNIDQ